MMADNYPLHEIIFLARDLKA